MLRVSGKSSIRSTKIKWKKLSLYVIALFRRNAVGRNIITYYVSNYKAPKKQHIFAYSIRWNIEKFFRTAKQKLGLAHCSARSLSKQKLHVYAVFAAYAYLETEKFKTSKSNPESVVSYLQDVKLEHATYRITSFIRNFAYVA